MIYKNVFLGDSFREIPGSQWVLPPRLPRPSSAREKRKKKHYQKSVLKIFLYKTPISRAS